MKVSPTHNRTDQLERRQTGEGGTEISHVFTRCGVKISIARAERDGTREETRFHLSSKRTSPFKSVVASVQSTASSRGVRISLSNAGYITFGGGMGVLATHSIRQFPLPIPSRASPCATRFRTSSTRNISGGKGGRCVRVTISPPLRAECHEIWEPKSPGTLWATPGLLRDSFTFTSLPTRVHLLTFSRLMTYIYIYIYIYIVPHR